MLKGYKYRLHPTPAQAEFLIKTIGCARFIYNKLLEDPVYFSLAEETEPRRLIAAYPKHVLLSKAARAFIQVMKEVL